VEKINAIMVSFFKCLSFLFLGTILYSQNLLGQSTYLRNTDFRKADSVAALYPDHSLTDLNKLSLKLTAPFSTEQQKFRTIYSWVCNNIENDYEFYVKNKKKREQLKDKPDELAQWNFCSQGFSKIIERT
jgi:hypothetical protein